VVCQRTLLSTLLRQGRLLADGGSSSELQRIYRRAIEVGESLAAIDPAGVHPRYHLACARLELASALGREGHAAEARSMIDRSISAMEDLVRECAGLSAFKQSLATAHAAQAELLLADSRRDEARGAFRRAAALFEEVAARIECDPEFTGQFARFLACCPLAELRAPARAVEFARRATRRFPTRGDLWSTLALSCYRAGDWNGAIAAGEESIQLRHGAKTPDRLVLALAHHRAGHDDRGRQLYRAAIASIPPGTALPAYLRALGEEAAGLWGRPAPIARGPWLFPWTLPPLVP
jgi:tetratricopeptide (TPR) repeat protein